MVVLHIQIKYVHVFMELDLDRGITLSINVHIKPVGCFMPQRQARQHSYYGVDFSILRFTTKLMSWNFF